MSYNHLLRPRGYARQAPAESGCLKRAAAFCIAMALFALMLAMLDALPQIFG